MASGWDRTSETGQPGQFNRKKKKKKKIWHSNYFNDLKNVYLSINGLFDVFSFQIFKKQDQIPNNEQWKFKVWKSAIGSQLLYVFATLPDSRLNSWES